MKTTSVLSQSEARTQPKTALSRKRWIKKKGGGGGEHVDYKFFSFISLSNLFSLRNEILRTRTYSCSSTNRLFFWWARWFLSLRASLKLSPRSIKHLKQSLREKSQVHLAWFDRLRVDECVNGSSHASAIVARSHSVARPPPPSLWLLTYPLGGTGVRQHTLGLSHTGHPTHSHWSRGVDYSRWP